MGQSREKAKSTQVIVLTGLLDLTFEPGQENHFKRFLVVNEIALPNKKI